MLISTAPQTEDGAAGTLHGAAVSDLAAEAPQEEAAEEDAGEGYMETDADNNEIEAMDDVRAVFN